ncbi:hypothetical protein ACIOG4_28690 [Streptomyces microflavus]|uniref:hypothetical protein n=1 Tax=Streptomyces microflavus TaxID=1919 RepID=UPI0037F2AAE1
MVLTAREVRCPQVSVVETGELDRTEQAAFLRAAEQDRSSVKGTELPFLWRLQPAGAPLPPPPVSRTPGWGELQKSLGALLRTWCSQLEAQVGQDAAAFNIVSAADRSWRLCGMVSPEESLTVFVDDRGGTGGPRGRAEMLHRGWQSFIPLLQVWDAVFERTDAGAASAAALMVAELRHRGVVTPHDLRLTELEVGGRGQLDLPGLGIAQVPASRSE